MEHETNKSRNCPLIYYVPTSMCPTKKGVNLPKRKDQSKNGLHMRMKEQFSEFRFQTKSFTGQIQRPQRPFVQAVMLSPRFFFFPVEFLLKLQDLLQLSLLWQVFPETFTTGYSCICIPLKRFIFCFTASTKPSVFSGLSQLQIN